MYQALAFFLRTRRPVRLLANFMMLLLSISSPGSLLLSSSCKYISPVKGADLSPVALSVASIRTHLAFNALFGFLAITFLFLALG